MVRNTCCVPGCRSSRHKRKTEENKKISLFSPPKDVDLFKKWQESIQNYQLTSQDKVCELHFKDDQIDRYYLHKLKDGTIHNMDRGRITLKLGAVPSLFCDLKPLKGTEKCKSAAVIEQNVAYHNMILDDAEETNKKIVPSDAEEKIYQMITEDTLETNQKMVPDDMQEKNYQTITDDDIKETQYELSTDASTKQNFIPHEVPFLNFSDILNTITSILMPSEFWGVTANKEFIIFSRWTKENDYQLLKKMVIEPDLNVRIFFEEKEVNGIDSVKFRSVEEITTLLNVVEKMEICLGATDQSMTNCSVYLNIKVTGRKKRWCENCLKIRRKYRKQQKRRSIKGHTIVYLKSFKIDSEI